jgi:membrane protein
VGAIEEQERSGERQRRSAALALAARDGRRIPAGSPAAAPAEKRPAKAAALFTIAKNVIVRISRDNLMLVAAGVAFYAMMAIFPAIAALVSIYGLFADPDAIQQQIAGFSSILPANSMKLVTDALANFASKSQSTLNFALLLSLVIAIWGAKSGVSSLMSGLNIANETTEKRSFIMQQLIGLALTFGAILFTIVALVAVALIPAIIGLFPLPPSVEAWLGLGRWPVLIVMVGLGLAVVYRFGPSREAAKWRWITWGASIATVLWVAGSAIFSFYVSSFASYDATYGSLAAPVVLLLWLWLSALVVLVGAEIDAELQHGDSRATRPLPSGAP